MLIVRVWFPHTSCAIHTGTWWIQAWIRAHHRPRASQRVNLLLNRVVCHRPSPPVSLVQSRRVILVLNLLLSLVCNLQISLQVNRVAGLVDNLVFNLQLHRVASLVVDLAGSQATDQLANPP